MTSLGEIAPFKNIEYGIEPTFQPYIEAISKSGGDDYMKARQELGREGRAGKNGQHAAFAQQGYGGSLLVRIMDQYR